MTDLVTRLRTHGCEFRATEDLLREAADEIERSLLWLLNQ